MAQILLDSASSFLHKDQPVAKLKRTKTTARGKIMRRKMTSGKKKAMGGSFSRRPLAPLSGNDEEEKEEEEHEGEKEEKEREEEEEEDEDEEEEEEEEDERKGWSD
jgi:TATA-binding protein-associated factor Taf7